MKLEIEISEFDYAIFKLIAKDPAEWAQNAVVSRIAVKKGELADTETARRRDAGEAPLGSIDALASAAMQRMSPAGEAAKPSAPDNPSLRDWRVGLMLWKRLDEVSDKVKALVDAGDPMGGVARESLEYANTVQRAQLMQLRDVFGFTADEVEESLWRADRVRQGDLSGVWPVEE
jgi:hypothetical protein